MGALNNPWYYKIGDTLIKKKKPCMPNDRVHLSFRDGVYTVTEVKLSFFRVTTKKGNAYKCTWDKFVCKYGEGHSVESSINRAKKGLEYTIINAQNALLELKNLKNNYVRYLR